MTPSSENPRRPPLDRQRLHLARWLAEWHLDRLLRAAPLDSSSTAPVRADAAPPPAAPAAPSRSTDARPRAGQIRLLKPPACDSPALRPIYVVLLDRRPGGSFCVVPFSRFATPAVPGEWRTGLQALPLRVLCVWNARVVPADGLERSWQAGVMPPGKCRQAFGLHRHLRHAAPLGSVRSKDLGPPLLHPLDPRHTYLAEEAALLDEHLAAIGQATGGASAPLVYQVPPSTLRQAAEERDPYAPPGKPGKSRRRRGQ